MFCNLHLKISVKCQRGEGDHNKSIQIFELFFNNSQIFPQITPDLLEVIENVFFGPNMMTFDLQKHLKFVRSLQPGISIMFRSLLWFK